MYACAVSGLRSSGSVFQCSALLLAWFTRQWTDARQERALEAERERLGVQLTHERALGDLAELRAVLEEAAISLRSAFDDYQSAAAAVWKASQHPNDARERAHAKAAVEKARGAGIDLMRPLARLSIRLDGEHPTARAFVEAMLGHQARVRELVDKGPQRYTRHEQHQGGLRAGAELQAFTHAARLAVGSELPQVGIVGTSTA